MRRLVPVLGWLLIAAAVWGFFAAAAGLPADGYELRFEAPLSAGQAESLCRAAAEQGLDLALWREEPVTLTTALGRRTTARRIAVYGSPSLCFPADAVCGTVPGAGQTDGCAVSAGLADALFGSRDAAGLTLTADGESHRVTGVLTGKEAFLLCPETADSGTGCSAASLRIRSGGNPRGTVQSLLQRAGLAESGTVLLPVGTLRQFLTAAGWLPLVVAALLLARQLGQRLPSGLRRAAGFGVLLAAALALPALLGVLPRWLIPARWSDPGFWTDLADMARQSLLAFVSLPDTVRDHGLAGQLLAAAGCALMLCAGALLSRPAVTPEDPADPDAPKTSGRHRSRWGEP